LEGRELSSIQAAIGAYRIEVATEYGPRLSGLALAGGADLFVRLDDAVAIDIGDGRSYRFRGGHRLWVAPESPDVTYAPDDHHCEVSTGDSVRVTAPADEAGFAKEIEISSDDARLRVHHTLRREGGPTWAAAWAITQLPLGGTAIIALAPNGEPPQADRALALWPYTRLDDPRIRWRSNAVLVEAGDGPPVKLGAGPGRLGYLRDGWLFIKEAEIEADDGSDAGYPDLGSAIQVYVGQGFCELETTGKIRDLEDGESLGHVETWSIAECADVDEALRLTLGEAA
jgi:hypothetical protein